MTAADLTGTTDRLLLVTARLAGTTINELRSPRMWRPLVAWRQAGMTVAQTHLGMSTTRAAAVFGRRDHTTAMHARRVTAQRPELGAMADQIVADLWPQRSLFE